MSQPLSLEDIKNELTNKIKDLERKFEQLRSNQNQVQEVRIQGHPQWTDHWTGSNSYVDVQGSQRQIDFDRYKGLDWYFEMTGFTDDGTGFWRLYNVTDGAAVADSEISTTSTSETLIVTDILPKPTGTKVIKIQHKQTGGSGSGLVNSVMSDHLFRFN